MKQIKKRRLLLLGIDILIFIVVFWFFDYFIHINAEFSEISFNDALIHCAVMLASVFVSRLIFGLYIQIWRYANVQDYLNLILADFIGGIIYVAIDRSIFTDSHLMIASAIAIVCSALIASLSARFIYQRIRYIHYRRVSGGGIKRVNVAIVGAGTLGAALAQELQSNPKGRYEPYCFIDSDPRKAGSKVCGLPVYGEQENLVAQVEALPVQEIIIAIDSLSSDDLKTLYTRYQKTGCKVKIYAHPLERAEGDEGGPRIRDIRIEDILYRETVSLTGSHFDDFYKDKVVLITGGAGSIGSELARQIAKLHPARLIIYDIYENSSHDIQQELLRAHGADLDVIIEIASVRDREKVEHIFDRYRPDIVFHAAAHKHVDLMEHCYDEAIKNNVLGTYHVANAAERVGVERFILISTDKAVNPTNMMGATKRLCEMIIQSKKDSKTRFAAVRFGNVLGSNGSVIPLFKRQIEEGGPITLTDSRIIRYFMTIPEAAQLLLQTGIMADNGEIFVLDMGKPVRILDLAESMIRLSGLIPYEDINIKEIGLRPGEKLYEELLMKTEQMDKTANDKIFIERDTPIDKSTVENKVNVLRAALADGRLSELRSLMMDLVPTYHDADAVNSMAMEAEEMKQSISHSISGELSEELYDAPIKSGESV